MRNVNISVAATGAVELSSTLLGRSGEHLATELSVTPDALFSPGADFYRISFGDYFSERLYPENGSFTYAVPEWALRPPVAECQIHAFSVTEGEIVSVARSSVFSMEVECSPNVARILPKERRDDVETELQRCGSIATAAAAVADRVLAVADDLETAVGSAEWSAELAANSAAAAETAKAAAISAASDAGDARDEAVSAASSAAESALSVSEEMTAFCDIFTAAAFGENALLSHHAGLNVRSVTLIGEDPAISPTAVVSACENMAFPAADLLTDNATESSVSGHEITVSAENAANAYAALDVVPPHIGSSYTVGARWKDETVPGNARVMVFLSSARGALSGDYSVAGTIVESGGTVTATPTASLPYIVIGLYVVSASPDPVTNSAVFYDIVMNLGTSARYTVPYRPYEYTLDSVTLGDRDTLTLDEDVAAGDVVWADVGRIMVVYNADKVAELAEKTVKTTDIASSLKAGIVRAAEAGDDEKYPVAIEDGLLYSSAGHYLTSFTVDTPAWSHQPTLSDGHFCLRDLYTGSSVLSENYCVSFLGTPPSGFSADTGTAYSVHIVDAENGLFDLMEQENDGSTVTVVTPTDGGGEWSMRDGGVSLYDYLPKGNSGRFDFSVAGRVKRVNPPAQFYDNSYPYLTINPTTSLSEGRLSGWFYCSINGVRYQNRMYLSPAIPYYNRKIREAAVKMRLDVSRDYSTGGGSYLCKSYDSVAANGTTLNLPYTSDSAEKPAFFRLTNDGVIDRVRFKIENYVLVNGAVITVKEDR